MIRMPDMPEPRIDEQTNEGREPSPSSLISAMAQLMQFVEKLDSHTAMLDSMPIDAVAKWDTLAGLIKKDVPLLKKEVSREMTGFLAMLLKGGNAQG